MMNASLRRTFKEWIYLLAEAIPMKRQTLHLSLQPPANVNNTSSAAIDDNPVMPVPANRPMMTATATLDEGITRTLHAACATRGISLDSVLLASLFLAAAEARAPRLKNQQHDGPQQRHNPTLRVRIMRFVVLAIVCVLMTVLSGSVDSKLMRYFCSFYAVLAGVWAVDAVTEELPGYTILMGTRAVIKAGEDAAGVSFTPVRMAVHGWRDLWDTADAYGRAAECMVLSMSEFARFKMRTWSVRGRRWRRKQTKKGGNMEARDFPPSFQLFGCIRLEGSSDGVRPALSPEEALGSGQNSALQRTMDGTRQENRGQLFPASDGSGDAAALLLIVLDSRYTLVYREKVATTLGATGSEQTEDRETEVRRDGVGGNRGENSRDSAGGGSVPQSFVAGDARRNATSSRLSERERWRHALENTAHSSGGSAVGDGGGSGEATGLELILVEGKRALSGEGAKWLVERARSILIEGCREGPPLNVGNGGGDYRDSGRSGEGNVSVSDGVASSPAW